MLKICLSVVFAWCLFANATPRLFFITGGVIERQSSTITESLTHLQKWVKAEFPQIDLTVIHNSHWKKVCEELKTHDDFLGMVGHSFGAQAIIDIAHCLADKKANPIDFFISLDSIQKPKHASVDEIPEGVLKEVNFYQNKDTFLRGWPNHHRKDGSYSNIQNFLIPLTSSYAAHSNLVKTVVLNGSLFRYLKDFLYAME